MLPNDIYMGIVYDSMRLMGEDYSNFFIDIKPKCGYSELIQGEALTTRGEVIDVSKEEYKNADNIRLQIYKKELFKSGPLVFLQANDNVVAHSGDITSLIYKKLGAKGFITDGNVRDIDKIEEIKFPIFCENENPIDALGYWALTKYQIPITIKGVRIAPRDYAFASRDGVIIVRKEILQKFKRVALEQLQRENTIRERIKSNDFEFENLVKEFGRW